MALGEYINTEIEGKITFSGSNLNNFVKDPLLFWDNVFSRSEKENTTSTILGTIVHHCASEYILKRKVDTNEIESYLSGIGDSSIDCDFIRRCYKDMANEIFRHIDRWRVFGLIESEVFMTTDVSKYGVFKGTLDCIVAKDTIIDFKTTSQLSHINNLPFQYVRQLQGYYYIAKRNGYPITQAKIVYITVPRIGAFSETTGKPLKDYPCQVYEVAISNDLLSMDKIKPLVDLIGESIDFIVENPDKAHLITRRKEQQDGDQSIDQWL